jgi:uncharacterized membrane protein
MARLLLLILGVYGFRLSRAASATIERLAHDAAGGDLAAAHHFTQTRYARVLGVKNSDLGMVYYGALALAAILGSFRNQYIFRVFRLGSWASLAMSAYLLWALFFRMRVVCPVCLKGHALNLATWWLLRRAS